MSGTIEGSVKAKAKYGEDFHKKIGRLAQKSWEENGRKSRGFSAMTPERRSALGRLGGMTSKRPKKG